MGTVDYFHVPAEVPEGTLTRLFVETVDQLRSHDAYMAPGPEGPVRYSYGDVEDAVRRGSAALRELGLKRGDRAAILSENRIEWPLADFSCLTAGVIDVPIYSTLTPHQVRYIVEDSQASLVFVSDRAQLEKAREALQDVGRDVHLVVFDSEVDEPGILAWGDFLALGDGEDVEGFRRSALEAEPGDVATLIYTSGTTGDPKGVMLTHGNLSSNVWAARQVLPVGPSDASLSFLPLSHVLQRMVDYLFFSSGCVTSHCSIDAVSQELRRVRPTAVVSVPRLYEKVYQRVTGGAGIKGRLARWAASVGAEWLAKQEAGEVVSGSLSLRYRLADRLVFRKIRAGIGGRLRYFVSGGAPLSPDINRFFHAAGVRILEGYGLTETSPVTNVNTLDHWRIGTVGRPVPGTEIRIAEDGEILIRGPQVMKGYYGLPEKTAEVLAPDGWFATGDIGEISEDGFLRITDRKKDLIKTSGGKYVAPQPIENRLKKNPFIDQAVVVGEARKFCSVLVVPAFDHLVDWARGQKKTVFDVRTLLEDETVQKVLMDQVFSELTDLARFEMPKKIGLLSSAFTVEDGTLTPTQKVKRKEVLRLYVDFIDGFYDESAEDRTVFVAPDPEAG